MARPQYRVRWSGALAGEARVSAANPCRAAQRVVNEHQMAQGDRAAVKASGIRRFVWVGFEVDGRGVLMPRGRIDIRQFIMPGGARHE